MRRLLLLVLASCLLPTAARASTVSISADGATVSYGAGQNEQANVVVTGNELQLAFDDSVNITATAPCVVDATDKTKATCPRKSLVFTILQASGSDDDDAIDASAVGTVAGRFSGFKRAVGTAQDDQFNADANAIFPVTELGGAGNDTLQGGAGDDTLDGGPGNDRIQANGGIDTITGGDGDDSIDSGPGGDNVDGGAGRDSLSSTGETQGYDFDELNPGATPAGGGRVVGVESVTGTRFDDVIRATNDNDTISGGPGSDTLEGHGGDDMLLGQGGSDTLLLQDGERDSYSYCDPPAGATDPPGADDTVYQDDNDTVMDGCEHINYRPGSPFAPNGTNATATATLSLTWASGSAAHPTQPKRPTTTKHVAYGQQAGTLIATVLNASGQPVVGATVTVLSHVPGALYGGTSEFPLAGFKTDGAGHALIPVGAGAGRAIMVDYNTHILVNNRTTDLTATANVTVGARISLKLQRARIPNGNQAGFSGRVAGGYGTGKRVDVQSLVNGRWFTFKSTRLRGGGVWSVRFTFRRTTKLTRYKIRARIASQAGFPFTTAASAVKTLTVVP